MMHNKLEIALVAGSPDNIKVTAHSVEANSFSWRQLCDLTRRCLIVFHCGLFAEHMKENI